MGVLVERDVELAAFERALEGAGSVFFVSGEAGIGKTTLVRAFAERAGRRVAYAYCERVSQAVPLAPFHDLVELVGSPADALAAARALLVALREPTLVVVEDAHWADAPTLDALEVVGRRIGGTGSLLVVTFRDDEEAEGARALSGALKDSVRLRPSRLSRAAVDRLAESAGLDGGRLFAATSGNPFLVTESINSPGDVPPTVRDATLARARFLGPDARGLLDVLAVYGESMPLVLLAEFATVEPAVTECLAAGVVVVEGDRLLYRHDLIRTAVEEAISPPRRLELHRRLAHAVAEDARVAYHAAAGGLDELAATHALRAAEQAASMGAFREAMAQYTLALTHGADRSSTLLGLGSVAWFADEPARASAALEELLVISPDVVTQARAYRQLGRAYWLQGRWEEAERAARAAVDLALAAGDSDEYVLALAWLANFLALGAWHPSAVEVAQQAVDMARAAGDDETLASGLISLGLASGIAGDPHGFETIAEGRRIAAACGSTHQQVRGYVNGLFLTSLSRDYAAADALFPEARTFLGERLLLSPLDDVTQTYAKLLLDRSRFLEAEALLAEAPRTDESFDAVLGFNAFQYAADAAEALREAYRVLRSGGLVAAMVWGPAEECELAPYLAALGKLLPPPPTGAPGPFALSEPGALRSLLESTGFEVRLIADAGAAYAYPDEQTALRGLLSAGPAVRAASVAGDEATRDATRAAIAPYLQPDGSVHTDNVWRFAIAHKP